MEETKKLIESFKSRTRRFSDGTIEVSPQEKSEPSQIEVKKVGKSKRYVTNGKNPLTCVELKCPEDVADKAAYFHKELAKLTKDMQIEEPQMPDGEFLLNRENVKVKVVRTQGTGTLRTQGTGTRCADGTQMFQSPCAKVVAWLTFETKGLMEIRKELYTIASEIDKCFVINEVLVTPQK